MTRISLLYLLGIALVGWGFGIGRYDVFPAAYIRQIEAFVSGDELEPDSTVLEKLANDTGIAPARSFRSYPAHAVEGARPLSVPGLRSRREAPLMFVDPGQRQGYRAIFGAFDFTGAFWGGLLLGPNGEVLHTWKLSTAHLGDMHDENKNMYGLYLFPDGSVIFSQQESGGGLVKVDACSNVLWSREGSFHHAVSPTGDGHFWSFEGLQTDFDHKLVKISAATGETVQTIDMAKVREKNQFVHIFDLQRAGPRENADISHGNDIEPLRPALAPKFLGFETGDLLISYRTQNIVFILDPDDLKIKWWRIGAWSKQHDPDWEVDGTLAVLSNNERTSRRYSDIVSIDPETFEQRILVDGEMLDFYSSINGEHSRTPYGTRMISSATQGWAFEVDAADRIVFSFVNNYDADAHRSLHVSEAERLDPKFFATEFWRQCSK